MSDHRCKWCGRARGILPDMGILLCVSCDYVSFMPPGIPIRLKDIPHLPTRSATPPRQDDA